MMQTRSFRLKSTLQALLVSAALVGGSAPATAEDFHWGYGADNGPAVWGEHFPGCNGLSQSPINLDSSTHRVKAQQIRDTDPSGPTCYEPGSGVQGPTDH